MPTAKLGGAMEFPVGSVDVSMLKRLLTIDYQPMGADEPSRVEAFQVLPSGAIRVPRQYGLALCKSEGIEYEDHTSVGQPATFPHSPKPRPYQVEPLTEIARCCDSYYDFLFRARTGWGKTIGALLVAARRGVSTIIIVDQENLKEQWTKVLCDPKLFGFAPSEVGLIQGPHCRYKGMAVTVAMVQTLSQKTFPQEVYDYFGLLIVDEVHIIGAPTFNRVLLDFSAAYRFGVSATPKRRDGLQKLLDYNLGRVRVYVEDEHEPSAVYVAEHHTLYSAYANMSPKIGRFITEVTEDGSRNLLIAESVAYLYDTGRDILVLSDRVDQLKHLESLCYYLGIPPEDMGVYAGPQRKYEYDKEPTPMRRPVGYERGTEYTPITLKLISKKTKKDVLERIKTKARVVFATYGKFSKGVDEPRFSAGVDASPRSTSEQVQGRILRTVDGKKKPIWITTVDRQNYRAVYAFAARLVDYQKNNAVVSLWSLDSGKTKCDAKTIRSEALEEVKRLKSMQIATNSDGLNMLLTKEQQIRRELHRGRDTTVATARRPSLRTGSLRLVRSAK